ncbi:unnamed protein product [Symbiodinium sp. CCMP2592]|nr:unnamed protein product [Symbiodinium sp. CCMP2592]
MSFIVTKSKSCWALLAKFNLLCRLLSSSCFCRCSQALKLQHAAPGVNIFAHQLRLLYILSGCSCFPSLMSRAESQTLRSRPTRKINGKKLCCQAFGSRSDSDESASELCIMLNDQCV